MNPDEIREDFPIFQNREDLHYLDNAATTHKPETVTSAIKNFYEQKNANVGRGLYNLSQESTELYQESRIKVADFINAETPDEIIFTRNTTESYNLVAESLDFMGDIVVGKMAHHSEQLPLRKNAQKHGKDIKYIETQNGKLSVESAEELIDDNTGLVSLSHMSNVFGAENPVKEIIEIAKAHNAYILLDGAQSVPRMPVDVQKLGIDLMAFSSHKMLGPTGIGVLYGKKHVLKSMEPYQVGGGMIKSVKKNKAKWEDPPEKFEAGTPNIAGAVGLGAAIDYLNKLDMNEVKKHDQKLTEKMIKGLEKIEGVYVLSPEGASLVSFTASWAHPHDVAEVLNQHGVAVRAGHHCAQPQMTELDVNGATRASPYIYNTEEDIEKFLEGVREAREVFKR
ncbi:aminotransferase class V-fold PLP-dependent enzyme [Candidatus Nanohalovita haloferacivicina]|uniref:aminotransferase class V-fold PLP-dependent enzyme n=1 Tax=Candidatus Nanohalovita haloferacivicina TaxID=2978046 RepID=UPI00325FDEF5|nr:Cysteine desulfurase / selenocysteine lyase [Candidatus Nanohalobia archaeon BNXNv]